MDNLSSVLRALFLTRDIGRVVKEYLGGERMPDTMLHNDEFVRLYLEEEKGYGLDSIGHIRTMVASNWMRSADGKDCSVFNLLLRASNAILVPRGDEVLCRYDRFLRWNEFTMPFGEALFVAANMAQGDVRGGNVRKVFSWKPFIASDNSAVNAVLHRGLTETHFHLEGSSLNFDINWMSLMNRRFAPNDFAGLPCNEQCVSLYAVAVWAAAARYVLYAYLMGKKGFAMPTIDSSELAGLLRATSDVEIYGLGGDLFGKVYTARNAYGYRFDGSVIDYALTASQSATDVAHWSTLPLVGERRLLYECLRLVYSHDSAFLSGHFPTLFYIYLLAKHKVRSAFVQQNRVKGFANFDQHERRKDRFCPKGSVYEKLVPYMAVRSVFDHQPVERLEVRVAPKTTEAALSSSLRRRSAHIGHPGTTADGRAKMGYTVHFIRRPEQSIPVGGDIEFLKSMLCRNYWLRRRVRAEAHAIAAVVRHSIDDMPRICGIDVANSEFNARPEVFASAFRMLRHIRANNGHDELIRVVSHPLGRTCHVAEDFYDIVDGLRAIEECLIFLDLDVDDRIGHAVALGLDVERYYRDRHCRVVMPKQVLLDNLAWLLGKMDTSGLDDGNGLRGRMVRLFSRYCNDVYGSAIPDASTLSPESYMRSWHLRGNDPVRNPGPKAWDNPFRPYIRSTHPSVGAAAADKKACRLYAAYHYDSSVKKNGAVVVEMEVSPDVFPIIESIQRRLVRNIAKRGIVVEANPTSNLRITDVSRYDNHPILRLNPTGLHDVEPGHSVRVSINTDDQGVFATSLEKEYTLMASALAKTRKYTDEQICQWLENVRRMSAESSFLR